MTGGGGGVDETHSSATSTSEAGITVVVDKFEEDARSSGRNDKLFSVLVVVVVVVVGVVESTVVSTSTKDFVGFVGKGAPEYFLIPNFILPGLDIVNRQSTDAGCFGSGVKKGLGKTLNEPMWCSRWMVETVKNTKIGVQFLYL